MLFYKDNYATLYQVDCRENIPRIDDKIIHMVVTSPPWYFPGKDGILTHRNVNPTKYVDSLIDVLNMCWKPLADDGVVFWHMGGYECEFSERASKEGWENQGCVVWDKGDGSDAIIVLSKQKKDFSGLWQIQPVRWGVYVCRESHRVYEGQDAVNIFPNNPDDDAYCECGASDFLDHQATLPNELVQKCLELGKGLVLDPFAGTGTTGVVARKLGRKSILHEINPNFCLMAKARLVKARDEVEIASFGKVVSSNPW